MYRLFDTLKRLLQSPESGFSRLHYAALVHHRTVVVEQQFRYYLPQQRLLFEDI